MLVLMALGCGREAPVHTARALPPPDDLVARCEAHVGEPRVEALEHGLFVARGFDLANTVVLQTPDGRVVIDAGMSPTRARAAREALDAHTSGPVRALILTHSHIDHVGGASVWAGPDTEIWATDAFPEHFFKQYGVFLPAEAARGARQFGHGVPHDALPCSAIGRTVDLEATLESGVRLPTHTFSGSHTLTVGGVRLELVEAHGETDDQLFVHLPDAGVLLPGDNVYAAFPNLYTIRGTRPRPTAAWIASLDAMRARDPQLLVPSHTEPVVGRDAVRERLTRTRDAIQWVRDAVVRGANAGRSIDDLAASIGLPEPLASDPWLAESYGQLDWSVRGIHDSELGWFDGRASALYPLEPREHGRRTLDAMGGEAAVRERIASSDDPRWTLELLQILEQSGVPGLDPAFADAYEALASTIGNTNGRAYLLVAARERRAGAVRSIGEPVLSEEFVRALPIEHVLDSTVARLRPEAAGSAHETVVLHFDDHAPAVLTVRHGVLEVTWGPALPGTPAPLATARLSTATWKDLALSRRTAAAALLDGSLALDGDPLAFKRFMDRFDQGLAPPPSTLP